MRATAGADVVRVVLDDAFFSTIDPAEDAAAAGTDSEDFFLDVFGLPDPGEIDAIISFVLLWALQRVRKNNLDDF